MFGLLVDRPRRGADPSTVESFANVHRCLKLGCMHTGRSVQQAYVVDSTGPKTHLQTVHKIEGTGANENIHRQMHTTPSSTYVKYNPVAGG